MSGDDVGRAATYAAEDDAFGGTDLDVETSLARLAAVAGTVTAGEWWRSCRAPVVTVRASPAGAVSSSARTAQLDGGDGVVIRLAVGQRTLATLTHELAHALAGVARGHDERFRAAHVDLVAMVAGAGRAAELVDAYVVAAIPAGDRSWPSPVRVRGDGFAVIP